MQNWVKILLSITGLIWVKSVYRLIIDSVAPCLHTKCDNIEGKHSINVVSASVQAVV